MTLYPLLEMRTWHLIKVPQVRRNLLENKYHSFTSFLEIMEFALRIVKEKGSIVRFWFGSKLGVALLDPRDIEVIQ